MAPGPSASARDVGDRLPISRGGNESGKAEPAKLTPVQKRRARKARAFERRQEKRALEATLAREYCRATSIWLAETFQISEPDKTGGKPIWGHVHRNEDLTVHRVDGLLFGRGGFGISTNSKSTRYVVIDVDFHPNGSERGMLKYVRRTKRMRTLAEARRFVNAQKCQKIVDELRARWGERVFVESSRRGVHVVFLLDALVECWRAKRIGQKLLWAAGRTEGPQVDVKGVSIEVFPDARGKHCRAPLTGGHRALAKDVEQVKNRHRPKTLDVQELLLVEQTKIAEVDEVHIPTAAITALAEFEGRLDPRGEGKVRKIRGVLDDEAVRDLVQRPLAGDAFFEVCRYLVRKGIPDDASRGACGKLVALLLYSGVEPQEAVQALSAFFRDGRHRSTRCRGDVATLASTAQWDVRRAVRLEAEGKIWFGGIKRRDLLALAEEICAFLPSATRARAA